MPGIERSVTRHPPFLREFMGLSHEIHIFPGSLQSFTITKQGMPDPHILHRTSPYDILS